MTDYRLSDLLDLSIIQRMTDAHYRAAGMPIGIIDAIDGSIIVGSGWQDICVRFHRVHPTTLQNCRQSDNYLKDQLVESEARRYKCKNGLWDIGVPIIVAGRHLATMFLGQFFYEGEAPDREFFLTVARSLNFDIADYLSALDRVPVFSHAKVDYILEYNKALASFIADLAGYALSKMNADEAIRESERKFHALFDNAYQFLGLLSTDGTVLEANKTALISVGATDAEVTGKPFWETPWWAHSADLREKVRDGVRRAALGEFIRFEATHATAAGGLLNVDFSLKPVMNESGTVVLLIPEGRDITERKQAEEEVKRQAEFLQRMIDAMPYPVFYKDRQGHYLSCNRAFEQYFGTSREQLAGKSVYEFSPEDLAEVYQRSDESLFARGGTQVYEGRVQSAGGALRNVIFYKATFEEPDGTLAGLVGVIIDITDRKNAEEEKLKLQDRLSLAEKMESVGRLAGGVAHDFNNILGVILGNAELALKELKPADALYSNLEEIRKAAERSAELTRQLLAFARKQTVTPRVLDLNDTVGAMLGMLRRLVGENVELAWMPGLALWQVRIDPAQIDQILMNLAANARDAIVENGMLNIETRNVVVDEAYCAAHVEFTPGEYVMLGVSDSGRGMDRETLGSIFEPFFTTKELGKGTGLGLATVYGIVKQNDGVINVYSEPGQGTTFKIYFPRHAGPDPVTEQSKTESMKGGTETVLLVEDEAMLLKLTQTMLEKLGYTVVAAPTPHQAIQLAIEHSGEIHVLMTDMVMPGMNGRDLAAQLLARFPKLKRLFMSGYTPNVIAHHGVLEEGVHFIQKPFSMKDLAIKIRHVLDLDAQPFGPPV